jgi:hypothetical protein
MVPTRHGSNERRESVTFSHVVSTCSEIGSSSSIRLPNGSKVGLDAQMEPEGTALEPDATPSRQVCRLGFLDQPEDSGVEGTRRCFLAGRHGQLHVIEADDFSTHRRSHFP